MASKTWPVERKPREVPSESFLLQNRSHGLVLARQIKSHSHLMGGRTWNVCNVARTNGQRNFPQSVWRQQRRDSTNHLSRRHKLFLFQPFLICCILYRFKRSDRRYLWPHLYFNFTVLVPGSFLLLLKVCIDFCWSFFCLGAEAEFCCCAGVNPTATRRGRCFLCVSAVVIGRLSTNHIVSHHLTP